MLISVITPAFNAGQYLGSSIESVQRQSYGNWEHHIVDGGSKDGTGKVVAGYADDRLQFVSEPDEGIYDAMNKGVERAKGDVIGILNADDMYEGELVLERVAEVFEDNSVDACYADLMFVDPDKIENVVRFWRSEPYERGMFLKGWMLPHPTLFLRRRVYEEFGMFDTQFRIGGDWDFLLRIFEKGGIRSRYVPETWIRMRVGGASTGKLSGIVRNNLENLRAFRKNRLWPRWNYLPYRFFHRIRQFGRGAPEIPGEKEESE